MINALRKIREIFSIFDRTEKKKLFLIQVLIITSSLLEVVGIFSIGPFITLIANPDIINTNQYLNAIYRYFEFESVHRFIFFAGIVTFSILFLSSVFSIFSTWILNLFIHKVGINLIEKLYRFYVSRSWLYYIQFNSAYFIKQMNVEGIRVYNDVISPFLNMTAKVILIFIIFITLVVLNPMIVFVTIFTFTLTYFIIYKSVKNRLYHYGKSNSAYISERSKIQINSFGGIKELIVLNRNQNFIDQHSYYGKHYAANSAKIAIIGLLPKYLVELIAIGTTLLIILFLVVYEKNTFNTVLPTLAIYAVAGLKLLPAFQLVYFLFSTIKGNIASFHAVKADLIQANTAQKTAGLIEHRNITFDREIALKKVQFKYDGQKVSALKNVDITIAKNKSIGIIGQSGAGKSTLIDIFLGLIEPTQGALIIDGVVLDDNNRRSWQSKIGFVPQSIFLCEGSITENIAFGVLKEDIDQNKILEVIKLSHLEDFISSLPLGIETHVGERGINLSGGQRQRVGIARALYHDAEVLLFDEATSALDGFTENKIMAAIDELSGEKTIVIVAHRIKTVKNCDTIYFLKDGAIFDHGHFDDLYENNEEFRKLVQLS